MQALGAAGLLPFLACAVLVWLPSPALRELGLRVFPLYSLVILCFLGGTLWGTARELTEPVKSRRLLASNALVVILLVCYLFMPLLSALPVLLVAHISLLCLEHRQGLRAGWYWRLRCALTAVASLTHLVVIAALL